MAFARVDVAIIGAGPYGLSLAAHLARTGRSFRIFGSPMHFWSKHMPRGMCLKSEGFASGLYDPDADFTLKVYCEANRLPYADIGLPVPLERFIAYGKEFQRRYVPELEDVRVTNIRLKAEGFEIRTAAGEVASTNQVVVATGIMDFAHLPPLLEGFPEELVTHSSRHSDLSAFSGRRVAVLGAGASAMDLAALLLGVGADVELIARRRTIDFHTPPEEPRPLFTRLKEPRSGLGTGWRSRLCTDIPLAFHALPASLRARIVARHLGPAPCWFVRSAIEGRLPMHLGTTLNRAQIHGNKMCLSLQMEDGTEKQIEVDHVIAATGYKVALSRLKFLDDAIQSRMHKLIDTPVLDRSFESSIPGLFFIGASAANSFGPMLRFAYGANYAAKRVARRLVKYPMRRTSPIAGVTHSVR